MCQALRNLQNETSIREESTLLVSEDKIPKKVFTGGTRLSRRDKDRSSQARNTSRLFQVSEEILKPSIPKPRDFDSLYSDPPVW
jgi:hypothetical protein